MLGPLTASSPAITRTRKFMQPFTAPSGKRLHFSQNVDRPAAQKCARAFPPAAVHNDLSKCLPPEHLSHTVMSNRSARVQMLEGEWHGRNIRPLGRPSGSA